MTIAILVFLGGALTILSPCILPVLPFVFARAEQPFLKNGLPLLAGMTLTFAAVATLAAVGGSWAVNINQYGRVFSLVLLTAFAMTLLSRRLADLLARPFIALGNRLSSGSAPADSDEGVLKSVVLGVATGLLWAPCAGPILGLVLTGAAISGPNTHTTILLFAYAAGAAASLAVALLAGGRVFAALKRGLGAGEWIRRGLGVAVLLAVATIALGWDSTVLTQLSLTRTDRLEQSLIAKIGVHDASRDPGTRGATPRTVAGATDSTQTLPIEGQFPPLDGATLWLNSSALTPQSLRGKVVVIDFWTYSCINCLRSLPFIKTWYARYRDHGLVVIGVHAPEFAFEKDSANVRRAVRNLGVTYPVALDNDYSIWQSFENEYWPAHYFIDAQGRIRGHHFGEGDYDGSEKTIRELLTEAGYRNLPPPTTGAVEASGVEASADQSHVQSPETYVGYERAANFSSPGGFAQDRARTYAAPVALKLNQWALEGNWVVGKQMAVLGHAPGNIMFRFYARDLHLVLGPGLDGKPVRFRVKLDGAAPGLDHGVDTDADGNGVVREQRLYQLVRQSKEVSERTLTIEFLDDQAQAYAFTFG
jgi:cytochrome c biogenesis protein CcdA/thiol-disulfide isomerase/thioredoxin